MVDFVAIPLLYGFDEELVKTLELLSAEAGDETAEDELAEDTLSELLSPPPEATSDELPETLDTLE